MENTITILGVAGIALASFFGWLAYNEINRFLRLSRLGVEAEGEIIGESSGRLGDRPFPIVRFLDKKGKNQEFRSQYPRRTKNFIHLKQVKVMYFPEDENHAEIHSVSHLLMHIATHAFLAFSFLGGSIVLILLGLNKI